MRRFVNRFAAGSLLGRAGLVTGAEGVNRITRIVTAIALARSLDIAEFGLAMAALTIHELVRMFIQNGLGTRIVAAQAYEAEAVTQSVHRLNWWLGISLCCAQLAIAWPIAVYFGSIELGMAVAVLALVHVIYPFAMVQVYLAQRADKWGLVAFAIAVQAGLDNLLTAALAIAGFGIWAVALPKIAVAVLWVLFHRRMTQWTASPKPARGQDRALLSYAGKVLGVELLASLRAHGDKAVVGLMLGPAALGLYAFAANIGKGITLSLSQSLSAVVLPHLRRGREAGCLRRTHAETMTTMTLAVAPFAVAVAATSDWLVPLLFGEKWAPASDLVAILAIASLAHPLIAATSQMLRASERVGEDLVIGAGLTASLFAALFLALPYGLTAAVIALAATQIAIGIAVAVYSFRSLAGPVSGPLPEATA
jgi:teichuronic acid exporter